MNHQEIGQIITLAASIDQRVAPLATSVDGNIVDARVAGWHMILGEVPVQVAFQAVKEIYSEAQLVPLQPGLVMERCKQIRSRGGNVSAVQETDLVPPSELADATPQARIEWRKLTMRAIRRGVPADQARDFALQQVADQLGGLPVVEVASQPVLAAAKQRFQALTAGRGFNAMKSPGMDWDTKTG